MIDPITLEYVLTAADESFEAKAELILHVDHRTVTRDPNSREKLFVVCADLRINGRDVPHAFSQPWLEARLQEWKDDQREQHRRAA